MVGFSSGKGQEAERRRVGEGRRWDCEVELEMSCEVGPPVTREQKKACLHEARSLRRRVMVILCSRFAIEKVDDSMVVTEQGSGQQREDMNGRHGM